MCKNTDSTTTEKFNNQNILTDNNAYTNLNSTSEYEIQDSNQMILQCGRCYITQNENLDLRNKHFDEKVDTNEKHQKEITNLQTRISDLERENNKLQSENTIISELKEENKGRKFTFNFKDGTFLVFLLCCIGINAILLLQILGIEGHIVEVPSMIEWVILSIYGLFFSACLGVSRIVLNLIGTKVGLK